MFHKGTLFPEFTRKISLRKVQFTMWIRIVQHGCMRNAICNLVDHWTGGGEWRARVLDTMNRVGKIPCSWFMNSACKRNKDRCVHLAPLSAPRRNLSTAHSISVKRDSQWPGKSRYYVILLVPTFSPFLSIFAIAARDRNYNEVSTGFTLFRIRVSGVYARNRKIKLEISNRSNGR